MERPGVSQLEEIIMTKLTCLVGTYNEAARLPAFLTHATRWADEVVVVDKGSTDGTREIAAAAGAKVFVTGFTPQGHENKSEQLNFASHDWVFLMTPGEVPTQKLIAAVRSMLAAAADTVDIITIPKKLYSFGIHNPASPWSIGQQPMLVNRKRAVISDRVHRNFSLRPGGQAAHIPYSEDCHVFHPTHATVAGFLKSHVDYIQAEIAGAPAQALLTEALEQIKTQNFGGHQAQLFGHECAWKFYWLGCALAAWEKLRGENVPALYDKLTEVRLREWR